MGYSLLFTIGFLITLMTIGILLYGRVKFGQFLHNQNPRRDLTENLLKTEKSEHFQNLIHNLKNLVSSHSLRQTFKKRNLEKRAAPL